MTRSRRYTLIIGLLAAAAVIALSWLTVKTWFPNLFNPEHTDPVEHAKLKAAELPTVPPPPPGDWPQYRGPNRNGVASADNFNTDWTAKAPKVAWKTPCGGGYGSVVVSGGRVYVQDKSGANERLLCLDAADGRLVWTHEYPVDYAPFRAGYTDGPRATPTVSDGRVYTVGATGQFRCVKLNGDGPPQLLWAHDLLALYDGDLRNEAMQWGFAGSPLIDGELVIVPAGGRKGSVVAFDRTRGEPKWAVGTSLGGYSSPVVGTLGGVRQVVAVTGDSVLGISLPDGKKLWEQPWKPNPVVNAASPVVAGEFVFVSSAYRKGCGVLRVEGASAKWVYTRPGDKGMQTWHSTAVHRDGFLYGFDGEVLRCFNLREGTFAEDWEAKTDENAQFRKGGVLLVGDKLLIQPGTGGLHLADADSTEFRYRGRATEKKKEKDGEKEKEKDATGPGSWATPAVVGGRIFTRDAGSVVCVDASK